MHIKKLLKECDVIRVASVPWEEVDVRGVASDSRDVGEGILFVATRGPLQDGHRYIADALNKKAAAIVCEDASFMPQAAPEAQSVPFILVRDSKKALARIADIFFGFPYQRLCSVGITGTNGKTTTSYLVKSILDAAGRPCALIGTIGHKITGVNIPSQNTTPGVIELHQLMREMADAGNTYVAMEVSSHALDQDRVAGIAFRAAIFTNLTQDHLDYHQGMENYFRAKKKLFRDDAGRSAHHIINVDDAFGRRLFEDSRGKKLGYGFSKTHVVATRSTITEGGSIVTIQTPCGPLDITTKLIGKHNLYNILAAVAFGVSEGLSLDVIGQGVEALAFVPGRLERIESRSGFSVFVDYAHTDDALKNVLESLRSILHNGRIITVFGCGGNRDKGKRSKMGRVASALSDHCVITSDNPRGEDPQAIIREIVSGIIEKNYDVEPDRRQAIRRAIAMAKSGDFVLVAGKGHETYQVVKDKIFPFDDKAVVGEALAQLSAAKRS
jgi:UDP-N-acetylmuramoyl-L-alanyl-D-glutamate--2,6-diaminopimelate ligase